MASFYPKIDRKAVSSYLNDLDKSDLKNLGRALGLLERTVNDAYEGSRITEYRDSILKEWMLERDDVLEKGGANWGSLISALRELGHNGIAAKIIDRDHPCTSSSASSGAEPVGLLSSTSHLYTPSSIPDFSKNQVLKVQRYTVSIARRELLKQYEAILRREFSCLVSQSAVALEKKLITSHSQEKFFKDMKRRYRINGNEGKIEQLLDAVCDNNDTEPYYCHEELFCILVDYVDEETSKMREIYKGMFRAWQKVMTSFKHFEELERIHSHTLQVRYKEPPEDIENVLPNICKWFKLPDLKIIFSDERYGSLLLTWVIENNPIKILLMENLSDNLVILHKNFITHLIYDFEVLHSGHVGGTDEGIMLFIETDYQKEPLLLFDIDTKRCKVADLKEKIEYYWYWLKYFTYDLLFRGKALKDNMRLKSCNIKDRSRISIPRVNVPQRKLIDSALKDDSLGVEATTTPISSTQINQNREGNTSPSFRNYFSQKTDSENTHQSDLRFPLVLANKSAQSSTTDAHHDRGSIAVLQDSALTNKMESIPKEVQDIENIRDSADQVIDLIDKALEESSIDIRNIVGVVTGQMGSGKTTLLNHLFNQTPPSHYTSTAVTEQSLRGVMRHVGIVSSSSLEAFSYTDILKRLALHLHHQPSPPIDTHPNLPQSSSLLLPSPDTSMTTIPSSAPSSSSKTTLTSTSYPPPVPFSGSTHQTLQGGSPISNTISTLAMEIAKVQKSHPLRVPDLSTLELVHMIDTGSQPEHMENMPSLVHNCHLVVLVLNLQYGLDDYPFIHQDGKTALPSQYSIRQIIQKLASTLQVKRYSQEESQVFRLLVVATHRDCLRWWQKKRISEYDQALREILLPACKEELIHFTISQIMFDINVLNPNREDQEKLALIREVIGESGVGEVVKTPVSFLLFEQELMEFSEKKVGRFILSLDECLEVGAKLKMNSEMVRTALIYFHHQFTFLYFPHVLPDIVFTKPQVPLDCINNIMEFSYKVLSDELKQVSRELETSLRDGMITEKILSHNFLSNCFIEGLYEPCHAIDLFVHIFTLAQLSRDSETTYSDTAFQTTPIEREKRKYLMICLCKAIQTKDIPLYLPPLSEIAPMVIRFTSNTLPISCYSKTVSCLLGLYEWELSRAEDGSPKCLAQNVVSLFNPQMPGQIIVLDTGHSFHVHISPGKGISRKIMSKICFQVKETILTAIKQVFECLNLSGIELSHSFLCPCKCKPLSHSASPTLLNEEWFLQCTITGESVGAADESHLMWLETPATETTQPTLPQLLEVRIHQAVGKSYRIFGTFLLKDEDGTLVDIIETDYSGRCREITMKILREWLQGTGLPPTWNSLTSTLRKCKLNKIASNIESKYISSTM